MGGIGFRMAVRRIVRDRSSAGLLVAGLSCGVSVLLLAGAFGWTVLAQPFPFPESDRIVRVFETVRRDPADLVVTSVPVFDALDEQDVLEDLALLRPFESAVMTVDGDAVQLGVSFVAGRYFDLLGAAPALGRLPSAEELDGRADPNVVLLAHAFWQREFGGDPDVVGTRVDLGGAAHEIVGVAEPSVVDISSAFVDVDAWLPTGSSVRPYPDDFRSRPSARYFHVYGRLAPEQGLRGTNMALDAASRRFSERHPESHGESGVVAMPLRERFLGDVREPAIMILAGAGFLLLVAWINALSLAASRATRVTPQMWIQLALGGTRRDVLIVGVAEYGVLLCAVAAGTVLLTRSGLVLLDRTADFVLPAFMTIELPPMWLPAMGLLGVAVLGTLLAGPVGSAVARLARADRARAGAERAAALGLGVQVGVATSLALGAVVLGLSLRHLGTLERGYEPRGVTYFQTDLGGEAYPRAEDIWTVGRGIDEALASTVAEVTAASVWSPAIPGWSGNRSGLVPEGATVETQAESVISRYHSIGAGALGLLGIEIVRGRDLAPSDRAGAAPVAVVSETAARLLWPELDPIGRRLRRFNPPEPGEPVWFEVVGVARDALHSGRISGTGVEADVYFPFQQVTRRTRAVTVLVAHDPARPPSARAVHAGLQEVGLAFPRPRLEPLYEAVSAEEGVHRAAATSVSALAAAALFLSLLGVFGVMAARTERARREVGIRRALGADDWSVVRTTARAVAVPVAAGVVAGVATGFGIEALIGSLVVATAPTDPRLMVALAATVVALSAIAALPPLLRAVRADPVAALRDR